MLRLLLRCSKVDQPLAHIPALPWISFPFRSPQCMPLPGLHSRLLLVIRCTHSEMLRQPDWPRGRESEQTPGDSEGQGSPACCSPRGHGASDPTQRLNKHSVCFKTSTWWCCEPSWECDGSSAGSSRAVSVTLRNGCPRTLPSSIKLRFYSHN